MKVITANRLADGCVVYLSERAELVEDFADARFFSDDEADAALVAIARRKTAVANAYIIEADFAGPTGREALRENIRRHGPTVKPDPQEKAVRDGRL